LQASVGQRHRAVFIGLASAASIAASAALSGNVAARAASAVDFPRPAAWPTIERADGSEERVGPGVDYQRWRLATTAGPLQISIARVDLRDPFVRLAVASHGDGILGAGEPLAAMANRVGAEAGINADYFDINGTGSELNALVMGGRIQHQPDGRAALAVASGNSISMGPMDWSADLSDVAGATFHVSTVNDWAAGSDITLATSMLGTPPAAGAAELILEPLPASGTYHVARLAQNLAALVPLGPEQLGVVARGASAQRLADEFGADDSVQLVQRLTCSGAPCSADLASAVGGGPLLLRGGLPVVDPDAPAPEETRVRYPVTGAGVSADGATLWLVVVDGRAPATSIGITRPMLGALFAALGASDAMAFDSGGSSEMVVRHLGDAGVSVVNVPSDGRERAIADGLFVVNAASPGPAAQLILRAPSADLLVGSHMDVRVEAVDANDQPLAVDASRVFLSARPPTAASMSAAGTLTGLRPGTLTLTALAYGIRSSALVSIVPRAAALRIAGYARAVPVGASLKLSAAASAADGTAIAVDPSAIHWVSTGGARVDPGGSLTAGPLPGYADVRASVGGATAVARIPIGEHPVAIARSLDVWNYSSSPPGMPGGVDAERAPDGSIAVHLSYDFSATSGTRAAYANAAVPLPGEPLALSLDVYGDGHAEWLRGSYRNADGIVDPLTLARHVDWTGWRKLRIAIPAQARWPIALTRVYVTEAAPANREQGSIWLRDFRALEPGP